MSGRTIAVTSERAGSASPPSRRSDETGQLASADLAELCPQQVLCSGALTQDPIELSERERQVATIGVVVFAIGEVGFRVLDNTAGLLWPSVALLVVFLAFTVGFAAYIARSRQRSFRSVLAIGVPDRLRRHPS